MEFKPDTDYVCTKSRTSLFTEGSIYTTNHDGTKISSDSGRSTGFPLVSEFKEAYPKKLNGWRLQKNTPSINQRSVYLGDGVYAVKSPPVRKDHQQEVSLEDGSTLYLSYTTVDGKVDPSTIHTKYSN